MPPEDDRPSEVREKPAESKSDSSVADLARTGQEIPQDLKNAFQQRAESRMKGLTASSRCLPGLDLSSDDLAKPALPKELPADLDRGFTPGGKSGDFPTDLDRGFTPGGKGGDFPADIDRGFIPGGKGGDLAAPPDAVTLPRDIDPGFAPEPGWKTGADVNFPVGTNTSIKPDGTVVYEIPGGVTQERLPDGSIINLNPNGTTEIRMADGTVDSKDVEGNWTTTKPDGTVTRETPDGTKVTESPDGTVTTEKPDGTTLTETPDGRFTWSQIPRDLQLPGGEFPDEMPQLPGDEVPRFPGGGGPSDLPDDEFPRLPNGGNPAELPPGGEFPGDEFTQLPGGGFPGDQVPGVPGGELPGDQGPGFPGGGGPSDLPDDEFPRLPNGGNPAELSPGGEFPADEFPQLPGGGFPGDQLPGVPGGGFPGNELPADLDPGFVPGGRGSELPLDFDPGFTPGRDLPVDRFEPADQGISLPDMRADIADVLRDADLFKKAADGGSTDTAALLSNLESKNSDQIQQLKDTYEEKYGLPLKFELAAVMSGDLLERALQALDTGAVRAGGGMQLESAVAQQELTGISDIADSADEHDKVLNKVQMTYDGETIKIDLGENNKLIGARLVHDDGRAAEDLTVVGGGKYFVYPDGRVVELAPDKKGGIKLRDVGSLDADSGTISQKKDGFERIISVGPGREDIVQDNGDRQYMTVRGDVGLVVKATGDVIVNHTILVNHETLGGAHLKADGTITMWGVKGADKVTEKLSAEEQQYLKKHPDIDPRDLVEIHRSFHGHQDKIDDFYKSLEKLDSAKDLGLEQKNDIRNALIHHVAAPAEIYQGITPSCNVTVIERDLAMTDPAKYASTVVQAITEGTITADGKKVPLDKMNLTQPDSSGRDLASRIFQTAALRAEFWPTKVFMNTADGIGRLEPGKSNEGATEPYAFHGLKPAEIADIRYKLTGQEKAVHEITSTEDLQKALDQNKPKYPTTITVDSTSDPFGKGNTPHKTNHVVTIVGEIEGPPHSYLVQNQWGLEQDHSSPATAIPADRLVKNMTAGGEPGFAYVTADHKGDHNKQFKADGTVVGDYLKQIKKIRYEEELKQSSDKT